VARGRVARGGSALRQAAGGALRAAYRTVWLPHTDSPQEHWQRICLNEAVAEHIESLDPTRRTAVEISGHAHTRHRWKAYTSLNYPEFDLCAPLGGRGPFDVVICEQVLEHVVDPWAAARTLRDLCAEGGHVIVSTPFLVRVHEVPAWDMRDYWRFTPRGLRTLLEGAGLQVDSVGSWGNRQCVRGNLDVWPAYRRWMSLHNEPDLPLQVWAFARRGADERLLVSGAPRGAQERP
jgi:SAM-dependent methyltransferase